MTLSRRIVSPDKSGEEAEMSLRSQSFRRGIAHVVRLPLIIAIFALAGPPIGGIAAWATMGALSMRSPVPFVAGSYGEGMVLAFATGVVVAVAAWFGMRSWLVAVTAALLANLAFHTATMAPGLTDPFAALLQVAGVFLPASIAAALGCWVLALPLLRKS